MGKSCNCCKTGCPKCALCERTLTKLKFSFLNDDPANDYKVEINVNEPMNAPCLKYFYIGDATGYYEPDGTRVPYRMGKMVITASPGTNFSEDLIPCTSINNNHTITKVQRNANQIEITFPDERFYRQKANRNFLPDIVHPLSFRYANDKKAEFLFSAWDHQLFQAALRNYESLDPSLVGKYPELKNCTVSPVSFSDLLGGGSLFRPVISGDLKCQARWADFDYFRYIKCAGHSRCRPWLGEIYTTSSLSQWHMDGFTYLHSHGYYKKIYHGFLVVVNSGYISIYPNIQEFFFPRAPGSTKNIIAYINFQKNDSRCAYDLSCTGNGADRGTCGSNFYAPCDRIIEQGEGEGFFGDNIPPAMCPSCIQCPFPSSSWEATKPLICISTSRVPVGSISSEFDIVTLPSERTWTEGCCCSDRYRVTDTYFDFALSYFTSDRLSLTLPPPGFVSPVPINPLLTTCSNLSIASKASVTLELKPLGNPLTQTGTENPSTNSGNVVKSPKCLSDLPSNLFMYTIGGIPKIKGFELRLGSFYTLKCSTDFNDRLAPLIWSGDSTSFVSAFNSYETGIMDCDTVDGHRDSLINSGISFDDGNGGFIDSDFNRVGQFSTSLTSNGFFEKKTKRLINRPNQRQFSLNYFNQTQPSIEFTDRLNVSPPGTPGHNDLWFLKKHIIFKVRIFFITDRINTPVGVILTPLSRLKMYVEVDFGYGPRRSGIVNINNPNDINRSLVISLGRVGVNVGGILDPGGVRFVPDPVFDNRSIEVQII
jgi:hypothetical protein